ncbi:farnesol dehydrogenase [Zeugodacus cucurbitae]|uniref:Dehydrogenase/reductase SDR family member 11 n=1 Tax=Zeugodacus cucurbitae TaxID=28588 RepID=A0A0A1X9X1_ZEUCU|nr:farnesol dehydrogenase [Zeugodacus cucurbitae]
MERWQNRVAVVTGASGGIGAAVAKYLATNKLVTINLDVNIQGYDAVRAEVSPEVGKRMHCIRCDLRKEAEIKAAFKEIEKNFGPISVLVNNAGVLVNTKLLTENNTEDLLKMVETNLLAAVYCTREAFRSMKANGIDGHVFLMNSLCGHKVPIQPDINLNLYSPTKFAITALTEMYRQEFLYQNTKIKVTSISPGQTATNITKEVSVPAFDAHLSPNDIADTIIYCLQTPAHVQIHDLVIKPIGETL